MTFSQVPQLIVALADQLPKDDDVKAGWTAFAIFILLIVAVALLGWSLSRQLKKAARAEAAGVYGSDEDAGAGPADHPVSSDGSIR